MIVNSYECKLITICDEDAEYILDLIFKAKRSRENGRMIVIADLHADFDMEKEVLPYEIIQQGYVIDFVEYERNNKYYIDIYMSDNPIYGRGVNHDEPENRS